MQYIDKENIMKKIIYGFIIGTVLIIVVVLLLGTQCVSSHTEKQLQMPVGVVVGGGNSGGISVPVGNAREVEVWVCDKYEFTNPLKQIRP